MDVVYATLMEDHRLTLEIIGTLDLGAAFELRAQVDTLLERGLAGVCFDLEKADCVTSVGISALAQVWERCSRCGVEVRFVNVSTNLARLFQVAGVREIFLGPQSRAPAGRFSDRP